MDRTKNMCVPPEFTADMISDIVADVVKKSNRRDDLEEIIGDYDLDRLRELVQADREGRCVVLPAGGHSNEDGERALKNAMFVVSLTNNGVNRYIADAIAEKITREAAEATRKESNNDE